MPEYALYDVKVLVYSPVHIGTGETLLQDYDYVVHDGRTWRLNLDVLLDEKVDDPALAQQLARTPPGQLLGPDDFGESSPLFRYVLAGTPRSQSAGAEVRELIKDAWGRPYLPGSSLKGALRTALLWHAATEYGRTITVEHLDPNPKFAARRIERALLRQDRKRASSPNYDLLRALQVSDSAPLDRDALKLYNVRVIGGRNTGQGAPVEVEAIRARSEASLRLKVDRALFSDWAQRHGLRLAQRGSWLDDLPAIVQRFSAHRAEQSVGRYGNRSGMERMVTFYQQLMRAQDESTCFLQLGWGGGWDSKTLGAFLQRDPVAFEAIARRYRLRRGRGRARPGAPFPTTQQMLVRRGRRGKERIAGPLGWVRLTFERRA